MKKLIGQYNEKIVNCDKNIERIIELIREARKNESINIDDLRQEKANVNRDRQLYVQFVKDLEDYA